MVTESTGYPGSQATQVPRSGTTYDTTGTTANSAFVVPSGASTLNGDRVPVGAADSLVALQADQYQGSDANILSGGITGDLLGSTGIPGGSYSHTHGSAA